MTAIEIDERDVKYLLTVMLGHKRSLNDALNDVNAYYYKDVLLGKVEQDQRIIDAVKEALGFV